MDAELWMMKKRSIEIKFDASRHDLWTNHRLSSRQVATHNTKKKKKSEQVTQFTLMLDAYLQIFVVCKLQIWLTSSFDSSLSLICVQNTGSKMPRHNGSRKIFESTRSLMHFIFHWVSRPAGIFVIISTIKLLWKI